MDDHEQTHTWSESPHEPSPGDWGRLKDLYEAVAALPCIRNASSSVYYPMTCEKCATCRVRASVAELFPAPNNP